MDTLFSINPQLDIPIYQQLVDQIRAAVRQGRLTAGQQLPTVQDVSCDLGIARGTIKRAYDELERSGIVEKVQGRGTFVCYRPQDTGSRKDQAMAAIDEMLDALESMGFSAMEINIFLDLKLRQRAQEEARIRIAVVECNTENLTRMAEQLRAIPHVELQTYLVGTVRDYPYNLGDDTDLIVTTATHADELEQLLGERKKVIRVALRLESGCMLALLRLQKGQKVGILCSSLRFGQLLAQTCHQYAEEVALAAPRTFEDDVAAYLADKDALLLPEDYLRYCGPAAKDAVRRFGGTVILCGYELDEGSFLYLKEKTKRMLETK